MRDQITKSIADVPEVPEVKETKTDSSHMTKAQFLDPKLILTITFSLVLAIAMTSLISIVRNNLGTVSFGGAK